MGILLGSVFRPPHLIAIVCCLALLDASAATRVWTGASTNTSNWSDPANWDFWRLNHGDELVFPADASRKTNVYDLGFLVFTNLLFSGPDYFLDGGLVYLEGEVNVLHPSGTTTLDLQEIRLRRTSRWNVEHPDATLFVNVGLTMYGYDIICRGAGNITIAGSAWGWAGIRYEGTGTLWVQGSLGYTVWTSVGSGTIRLDGSLPSSKILLYPGATLLGSGSANGIWAGGLVSPGGATVATLHSTDDVEFSSSATLRIDLAGSACDQLRVQGNVELYSCTLDLSVRSLPSLPRFFSMIDNRGTNPVSGAFANLPEGTQLEVSNRIFQITYRGGDGNDVGFNVFGPPSLITSIERGTNRVRIFGSGEPFWSYTLEAATNLTTPVLWIPVATSPSIFGRYQFTDSNILTSPTKFYRVLSK